MLSSLAFDADAFDNAAFLFEQIVAEASEAATAGEASDGTPTGGSTLTESVSASDAIALQAAFGVAVSESVVADSAHGALAAMLAAMVESAAVSEQSARESFADVSVIESASAAESMTSASQPGGGVLEGVTAAEYLEVVATLGAAILETIAAADSSTGDGGITVGGAMPYVTRAQLYQFYGQSEIAGLIDRDNDGAEDAGVLAYAIANADALIDGYLRSRYEVPLAEVPQLVSFISADIARYYLWEDNAPDEVRKRYEERVQQLKEVAKGIISLPVATPVSTTGGDGGVEYVDTEPLFSMSSLSDY